MGRTFRLLWLAAGFAALSLWAPIDSAVAGQKRQRRFRTTGLVRVTRDAKGNVTAVELHADTGTRYRITLDKRGLALGREMAGEKTRATGAVSKKDDQTWLTVRSFTNIEMAAAHEQWRRMKCNYCAVAPALVNSTVPRDLRGAKAIDGRPFAFKRQICAWARDKRFLWAATGNQIFQIDLAAKRLARSYTGKDGLPDQAVYHLLSDGKTLWVAYRGGVAALTIGQARVVDLPALKCNFARFVAGEDAVWAITDAGTFRLKSADDTPATSPALPTAKRITSSVVKGIWLPHWRRKTAHLLYAPACVGSRIYVGSYGDIYELAEGKWSRLAENSWGLAATTARVWFLCRDGVGEYEPETRKLTVHGAPAIPKGRCRRILATDSAVWVAVEPRGTPKDSSGGGLARLDLASRKWQTWSEINGRRVDRVTCLEQSYGALWALNVEGQHKVKPAHPGMTYVRRKMFTATGLCLHRFGAKDKKWETVSLGLPTFEKRLIIGQDGARAHDVVVPQIAEDISVGPSRVFGTLRLFPKKYFCGYYPCVEQLAVRGAGGAWAKRFEHRPADLGLQGEQPLVLNISNTGRMVLEAVGHDNVLEVFEHRKEHWAVTEGRVSWFDGAAGRWRPVLEPEFRFYWRATAALDDGRSLYVGSDRGLVSRLDFQTGQFELLTCLNQRSISRIVKDNAGNILVASRPSPLGILPVQLRGKLKAVDWTTAQFDGKKWSEADPKALPRPALRAWSVRRAGKRWRRHRMDKSRGNFLWGPGPRAPTPRLYVKGVFYPKFLCASPDGDRLWLSTYSGLLRLDGVKRLLGL